MDSWQEGLGSGGNFVEKPRSQGGGDYHLMGYFPVINGFLQHVKDRGFMRLSGEEVRFKVPEMYFRMVISDKHVCLIICTVLQHLKRGFCGQHFIFLGIIGMHAIY